MSFTVKVIFLGLIGFVPSPEGGRNMAALLIDPVRAQPDGATCPIPGHSPVVFLLHGKCQGKCYRGPWGSLSDVNRPDLASLQTEEKLPGLVWGLREEDLDLSGDEDEPLEIRKPLLQLQNTAPRRARQSSYFSWIPSMDKLTRGQGQVSEGCRLGNVSCPLYARFQIQGGDASTCHMFHVPESSSDLERNVRIFYYTIPGRRQPLHRAVADAVQVVFYEPGDRVTLSSKTLLGGERLTGAEGLPTESAYLSPDDKKY